MEKFTLQDIIQHKREKSFQTIEEAKAHIRNKFLSTAMNRIYYAGFYIVSALALLDNFSTSKHKTLIGYFNKEYIKTNKISKEIGKILSKAYDNRIISDYHDFAYLSKTDVEEYLESMERLIQEIDKIITDRVGNI